MSLIRTLFSLFILVTLCGCSSISYYGQSVIGHSKLMLARVPLDKAARQAELDSDEALLEQLSLAKQLRHYSVDSLSLPDNSSYSNYVPLEREFPVWTVVAAEEFSTKAKQWCYPIIGCASYRGYFSKRSAQKYAMSKRDAGFETTVGGAGAYSTLGWFSDPLLPSMMRYGVSDFAETLFHELAHQQLYIKGDSGFNEAFATVVGEQGALLWISEHHPQSKDDYQRRLAVRDDFSNLLLGLKSNLDKLYSSDLEKQEKRSAKQQLFSQLNTDYEALKSEKWNGLAVYDAWMSDRMNNAKLASFGTYRDQVPAFEKLLGECRYDFKRFYKTIELANLNKGNPVVPKQCILN